MDKPDLLEDLLALQYVYGDNSMQGQQEQKPVCHVCGKAMYFDKLEIKWVCLRCNL
jgi:ribosomal protein L37AE/L43A